jgi:hypothetical protein
MANLVLPILQLFSSAPPALIYGVVVCDLVVRGGAKLKIVYTIALFAAKQHAAMPWGLKVIRKSGYARNFTLIRALCQNLITRTRSQMPTSSGHFVTMGFQPIGNIDILHVRLYIRLQNFNFHPDRFSSNGAPTAVMSRLTNTSQTKSINLLMHLLGGHDAKLTVYLYEGFTFGHLVFFSNLKVGESRFMRIIIFYLLNKTLKL